MQIRSKLFATLLAAATLAASSAIASPLTDFDSRAAWTSATTNQTTVDFNIVGDGGWQTFYTADGYQTNGLQFVGFKYATDWAGFITDSTAGGMYDFGTDAVFRTLERGTWQGGQVPWIVVTLPLSTYAFGVDLMTYLPAGTPQTGRPVNVWVSDGTTTYEYLALSTNPKGVAPQFFGVVSPTPISWVKIQAVDAETIIDNFATGTPNMSGGGGDGGGETPEMATAILIISGLLFIRIGKQKFGWLNRGAAA